MRHARKGLARALAGSDAEAAQRFVARAPRAAVSALLRSGIFDLEYYSAAAGEVFPDRRAAARHCVSSGLPAGLSPNPFLSLGFLPRRIQTAWQRGNVVKVLDFLANGKHWTSPSGPCSTPVPGSRGPA